MPPDLDRLRSEARYWRERRDLYRAKAYGARPTTPARLAVLERAASAAEARLRHAEAADRGSAGRDTAPS